MLSSFGLSESEYFHKQTRPGPKLLAAQQRLTIYFLLDSPPVRDMVESMSEGHGMSVCERHLRANECSMEMAGNARKKLEWMFFYKTRSAWTDGGAMNIRVLRKGWLLSHTTSFGRTRQQTLRVWSDRNRNVYPRVPFGKKFFFNSLFLFLWAL